MALAFIPSSYPPDDVYEGKWLLTLEEQAAKWTFRNMHPEVQRRVIALELMTWEYGLTHGGEAVGPGTGFRVQLPHQPNHAEPGNSHHEGFPAGPEPASPDRGAVACDMVGIPTDTKAWAAMERFLVACGLINFNPSPASHSPHTTNIDGRPYSGSWDVPHVQPYEIPDSRKWRVQPYTLRHQPLPPKYDVEVVGLDPFSHPLWGGDNQEDEVTDDDIERIAQRAAELVWSKTMQTPHGGPAPSEVFVADTFELCSLIGTDVGAIKAKLGA